MNQVGSNHVEKELNRELEVRVEQASSIGSSGTDRGRLLVVGSRESF
jgi:hypothetical protein